MLIMRDRIIQFLKSENKSSSQLAEEIGVQPSGISHILSGRNKPSLDFILKMLEKYKFLSTEWLLFGTGPMYKENEMRELFTDSEAQSPPQKPDNDTIIFEKSSTATEIKDLSLPDSSKIRTIKIICLLSDGTFKEYYPG
jgi:transcriptional regulator with XRE-family HTH domain